MKRENIDGRYIYSDTMWNNLVRDGAILLGLGYKESAKKQNLFYKVIKFTDKDNKEQQCLIFCDLRGKKYAPIWKDIRPYIYYDNKNFPYMMYAKEVLILKRNGISAREYLFLNWFHLEEIPDGYCKSCKKDIINTINLSLQLSDYRKGIVFKYELRYCDSCKKKKYLKREIKEKARIEKKLREQQEKALKEELDQTCRLCGTNSNGIILHHITYIPEKILRVCPTCHGYIHKCTFPHYLWQQRRPEKIPIEIIVDKYQTQLNILQTILTRKNSKDEREVIKQLRKDIRRLQKERINTVKMFSLRKKKKLILKMNQITDKILIEKDKKRINVGSKIYHHTNDSYDENGLRNALRKIKRQLDYLKAYHQRQMTQMVKNSS